MAVMNLSLQRWLESWHLHLFLLIALLSVGVFLYVIHPAGTILLDFAVYFEAGQRFANGVSPYTNMYEIRVEGNRHFSLYYFYPPLLAWCMSWFSNLECANLKLYWCIASYLAWVAGVVVLSLELHQLSQSNASRLFWIVASLFLLLCFEPVYVGTREGQVNGFIFLCLVVYMSTLRRGSLIAGVSLALATLIKISPGLLILIPLCNRQWQIVLSYVLTGIVLMLLPALAFGSHEILLDFLSTLLSLGQGALEDHYVYNFAVDIVLTKPFGLDQVWVLRILLKLIVLFGGIVWWLHARKSCEGESSFDVAFLLILMVISFPTLWFHHLAWLIFPVLLLLTRRFETREQHYRYLIYVIGLYFALSQSFLIHTHARALGHWAPINDKACPLV